MGCNGGQLYELYGYQASYAGFCRSADSNIVHIYSNPPFWKYSLARCTLRHLQYRCITRRPTPFYSPISIRQFDHLIRRTLRTTAHESQIRHLTSRLPHIATLYYVILERCHDTCVTKPVPALDLLKHTLSGN